MGDDGRNAADSGAVLAEGAAPVGGAPAEVVVGKDGPLGERRHAVDDPADLTPAWMTEALRAGLAANISSGAAGGPVGGGEIEVVAVRHERIGTGQTGANYRCHLEYADPVAARRAAAPTTVVVKMGAGDPSGRDLVRRGYRNEVGFYAAIAGRAQINTPRCWQAAITADSRSFTLVLDDAAPATPGSQEDGCGVEQASEVVRNLAGLHAPFWNSADLAAMVSWLAPDTPEGAAFLGALHISATDDFITRFGSRLPAEDVVTLRAAAQLIETWVSSSHTPFSLLHGDYRLDNLLFAPDGPDTLAVDWQTLAIGLPARDLAYFLSTALPPALRREQESALVGDYHDRLVELGVRDYSVADSFTDYRRGMLQGPLITVLGAVLAPTEHTDSADRMFLSMIQGACAAIRDLDTLDLVAAG